VTETRLSRREFLKFLGTGAAALGLGVFGFNSFFNNNSKIQNNNDNNNNGRRASAQPAGSWDSPVNQPLGTTTIHAALIGGGKVFWIMGSANKLALANGPFYHGIWNPDGSFGSTNTLSEDLFCCGMATLANGNVLLCGGTLEHADHSLNGKYHGAKYAYEADFSSGSIGNRTEMAHGRWYPTCVTLPDGKVFVVEGFDEYGCDNTLVEFYDPGPKSWQIKLDPAGSGNYCVGSCATQYYPEAGSPCYGPGIAPIHLSLYPRMHLMPSGLIASVGSEASDKVYDPNTFRWVWSGNTIRRNWGTSVLCPLQNVETEKGKILVCGGSKPPDPATNTAEIVEPSGTNGLTRRSVPPMQYARQYVGPVILPTGQIVIFGGSLKGAESPVLYPEMFDPESETWTVWPAATVPRMYHHVSLLLHDGRVWTAGTTYATIKADEVRVEIFNPWYISETRPTISGDPTGGAYGNTITIPTPNASDIAKVSLVKVSATTHHYNTDQRLIWLQIESKTPLSVTVKAPINNKLAPPGYYLIHVLNSAGVPSVGTFIKIPGSANIPPATYTSIYSVAGATNSYAKLYTGNIKRAGELMLKNATYNSALIGQPVKRVNVILKKSGNPTGTISVLVRKASGDSIGHTFGTIDASTLTTTDKTFTVEAPLSYTLAANDRILVEWNGTGSTTDQVWVKKSVADTAGGFDGQNTRYTRYTTGYVSQGTYDLAGEWFKLV
jgi:hypothetical protein